MIEVIQVSKAFAGVEAVRDLTCRIRDGEVFGLVGTNGAGKSTLLRMLAGVLRPDRGEIRIDGEPVWENEAAKSRICFISDAGYFPVNATAESMTELYRVVYPVFDCERFEELMSRFGLQKNQKIRTFSRGMKKQLSVLLGICTGTKYLFCDETFDGLDPVMRQAVKSIFATEMLDREFVPVVASHNLRELEDFCDHVGLLHQGGILFSENLSDLKMNMQKVQCVIRDPEAEKQLLTDLDIVRMDKRGSMLTFVVRGDRDVILARVQSADPVFAEELPLTLEEIFITETEVAGYDIKNIIA